MAPRAVTLPREVCDALGLKSDESAFREGSATIVLPSKETAFLNPVQEFNRDISTLAIRTWSQVRNEEKRQKYLATAEKRSIMRKRKEAKQQSKGTQTKKLKLQNGQDTDVPSTSNDLESQVQSKEMIAENDTSAALNGEGSSNSHITTISDYRDFKFTMLEGLSATGLRSIRYAREIPLLKTVLANDLSSSAVDAMRRNVALNFPAGKDIEEWIPGRDDERVQATSTNTFTQSDDQVNASSLTNQNKPKLEIHPDCKIHINEGDAMSIMYSHREERSRFDVIDLDPYGSAAIFLDGAVQSVADGGLLCVTCTDTAVLAGNGYPEKSYSAYGGVGTRVEYCHEMALRLLLHAISTSAGRYGRYMEPMLSLSIDFYIRVFVRIYTRPIEVKKLASQTGIVLTCHHCQNTSEMRFGKFSPQQQTRDGSKVLDKYHGGNGPSVGTRCEECGGTFKLAGPMWLGRLHNREFCQEMLHTANGDETSRFKTLDRINGMVGMAIEELQDVPFYLTPFKISSFFHCNSPPLLTVVSALLFAGHQVSRSHCSAGSIKTSASRKQLFDLWRNWIKLNPVKMQGISLTSPAMTLLTKPIVQEYNLQKEHPEARKIIEGSGKGVRYQMNPLPNWGPGTAAKKTSRSHSEKTATATTTPIA